MASWDIPHGASASSLHRTSSLDSPILWGCWMVAYHHLIIPLWFHWIFRVSNDSIYFKKWFHKNGYSETLKHASHLYIYIVPTWQHGSIKSIIIGKTSPKIIRIVPMCASFRVPIGWSCVIFSAGMKETSPQCSAGEQCSKVKQLVIFSRSHPSSTYVYVCIYIYVILTYIIYHRR